MAKWNKLGVYLTERFKQMHLHISLETTKSSRSAIDKQCFINWTRNQNQLIFLCGASIHSPDSIFPLNKAVLHTCDLFTLCHVWLSEWIALCVRLFLFTLSLFVVHRFIIIFQHGFFLCLWCISNCAYILFHSKMKIKRQAKMLSGQKGRCENLIWNFNILNANKSLNASLCVSDWMVFFCSSKKVNRKKINCMLAHPQHIIDYVVILQHIVVVDVPLSLNYSISLVFSSSFFVSNQIDFCRVGFHVNVWDYIISLNNMVRFY